MDNILLHYKPDYELLYCDYCKGAIGIFEDNKCRCQDCRKQFTLYKLIYDRLVINNKTGWIFPVVNIKESKE